MKVVKTTGHVVVVITIVVKLVEDGISIDDRVLEEILDKEPEAGPISAEDEIWTLVVLAEKLGAGIDTIVELVAEDIPIDVGLLEEISDRELNGGITSVEDGLWAMLVLVEEPKVVVDTTIDNVRGGISSEVEIVGPGLLRVLLHRELTVETVRYVLVIVELSEMVVAVSGQVVV